MDGTAKMTNELKIKLAQLGEALELVNQLRAEAGVLILAEPDAGDKLDAVRTLADRLAGLGFPPQSEE